MQKTAVVILAGFLGLILVRQVAAQQITLTNVPYQLIGESESVTVTWAEPIRATLHYGTAHGEYNVSISKSGTQSLTFIPQNEGISPGVYYGIITNGSLRSAEFPFIVEASASPIMREPANNGTVRTATPEFQWDEVPGVPFYHLILSDHEAVLSRDPDTGELQLTGANIIWQVITPQTHITYGAPDPSGYFTNFNGTTPPLLSGKHYTWIVLNNYGNNMALTSLVQSGVSAFYVDLSSAAAKPVLISPQNSAMLDLETIPFRWQAAAGAVNYQISLFEYIYEEGSSSSFLIWSATTSNTSIAFPARSVLKGTHYAWRVLAMDNSGNGTASETRTFSYKVPVSTLVIQTLQENEETLPRANATIVPIDGTSDNVSFITSDYGFFVATVRPGAYEIRAWKEGFLDTTKTVQVEAGDTLFATLRLRKATHRVTGGTHDQAGKALPAVSVRAKENISGRQVETASDANGNFVLSLSNGVWDIWGQKENYSNADTIRIELSSQKDVILPNPLVLKEFDSFIAGKIVNSSKQPVIMAQVQARKGTQVVSQFTDNSGSFRLQVSSGEWTLTATKGGYVSPAPRFVQVAPGATVTVTPDLELQPNAGVLTGFVFSGQNSVDGAEVKATPLSGQPTFSLTDPKGAYTLNVAPGSYTLTVSKQGYKPPDPLQISLRSGETISNLNFNLQENPVFIAGKASYGGNPLEGVVVQTEEAADTTLSDGSYQLWVQPGTYRITATRHGYVATNVQTVSVALGENKTGVNFTLVSDVGTITGNVQQGNLPVAGATLLAFSGTDTFRTNTGNAGAYSLSVKPGTWTVRAQKAGFVSDQRSAAVQGGQTVSGLDFNLTLNIGTVTGKVTDNLGRSVPNALVEVIGKNLQSVADQNGQYTIQLEPGNYQLKAWKVGFNSQRASVSVALNSTATMNFSLTTKGTLTGKITDNSSGAPINKAPVWVILGSDTTKTETDYTGEYTFFLNSGTYTLVADQLGYHRKQMTVSVAAGAVKTQNVALLPNPSEIAQIQGRILDDFHKPMTGVPISLSGGKVDVIYTETDGGYDIKKLQTGLNYTLRPKLSGFFFVPDKRNFSPLKTDQTSQDFAGALYGDVSGNKKISSFDGSLILRISAQQNVSPYYKNQPRDSIAADVSGNGQVSSFDASLIFRYSVHLIDRFPVEPSRLGKELEPYSDPAVHVFTFQFEHLNGNRWAADIQKDNLNRVYATQWKISVDPKWIRVRNCVWLNPSESHTLAWSEKNGVLSVATAGAKSLEGSGRLFRILVDVKGEPSISPEAFLRVIQVQVNEGRVASEFQPPEPTHLPTQFHLFPNYPNPFNGETLIRFAVPPGEDKQSISVDLSVYNVLGQRVRQLVHKPLAPGYYQSKWDGTDAAGQPVSGGVYFYRLKAESQVFVKKLLFLK